MAALFAKIVSVALAICEVSKLTLAWPEGIAPTVAITNAGQSIRCLFGRQRGTTKREEAKPFPKALHFNASFSGKEIIQPQRSLRLVQ